MMFIYGYVLDVLFSHAPTSHLLTRNLKKVRLTDLFTWRQSLRTSIMDSLLTNRWVSLFFEFLGHDMVLRVEYKQGYIPILSVIA